MSSLDLCTSVIDRLKLTDMRLTPLEVSYIVFIYLKTSGARIIIDLIIGTGPERVRGRQSAARLPR